MQEDRIITIGSQSFSLHKNEDGTFISRPLNPPLQEQEIRPFKVDKSGLLGTFPSKSSPGTKHHVKHSTGLGIFCSCIGYGTHKHCFHTDFIRHLLNEDVTLEQLLENPIEIKEA